jgi:outer membrane protein OmpA-like peptidoglycan-associated protein
LENNKYGTPENVALINTEGRESFPFVSSDNELYFASDGHPGLGGHDIFVISLNSLNASDVKNIGAPVNSATDDFAFQIDAATRRGFFSSNRTGGKGNDDIYKFSETKKLTCDQILVGVITDAETKKVLANTKLTLSGSDMIVVTETTSDANGKYSFKVTCGKQYYVRAQKESYDVVEKNVIVGKESGTTQLDLELERTLKQVAVGDDLAKLLDIKVIYFDRDKSDIRPDAAFELEKILDVLKQYPSMKIDVRSHTDSRQTHKYNESLSDRRAKSTIQWLIANGISADRLTGKGYGETRLLNKCSDGVDCSEEDHQRNRRSEFIIMSLEK